MYAAGMVKNTNPQNAATGEYIPTNFSFALGLMNNKFSFSVAFCSCRREKYRDSISGAWCITLLLPDPPLRFRTRLDKPETDDTLSMGELKEKCRRIVEWNE
jgi:hypothetical protein